MYEIKESSMNDMRKLMEMVELGEADDTAARAKKVEMSQLVLDRFSDKLTSIEKNNIQHYNEYYSHQLRPGTADRSYIEAAEKTIYLISRISGLE